MTNKEILLELTELWDKRVMASDFIKVARIDIEIDGLFNKAKDNLIFGDNYNDEPPYGWNRISQD